MQENELIKYLKEKEEKKNNEKKKSLLDNFTKDFLAGLATFSIVYALGGGFKD